MRRALPVGPRFRDSSKRGLHEFEHYLTLLPFSLAFFPLRYTSRRRYLTLCNMQRLSHSTLQTVHRNFDVSASRASFAPGLLT